jgi:YbgC/YbaW family acyl-CoA thioester hydrolase
MSAKVFETKCLVRFPDCDPFNHMNNSRYIDYFMNAREDHLRKFHKFNLYEYAIEQKKGWVVNMSKIAYLKPASLMETITIESTLLKWRGKGLLVEMRMWDQEKQHLKAVLWSDFTHFDLESGRPVLHSEKLNEMFKPFENPLPNPDTTFEERVTELRRSPVVNSDS